MALEPRFLYHLPVLWVLTVGITIGLSAGLAPGPLMTLVVSHSLRFGFREGLKVALAPIFSDLPIVGLSIGLTAYLSDFDIGVVVISLAGGIYLCFLAWETAAQSDLSLADEVPIGSIRKGTLVNLLNPHPYLFWITVGAPLVFRIWEQGWHLALFFVAGFYVCLVGCKIIIAWLVSRSRHFLMGRAYLWVLRALGAALAGFGVYFVIEAFRTLMKLTGLG